VDIKKVQDLLGHRHITTTQIYDKMSCLLFRSFLVRFSADVFVIAVLVLIVHVDKMRRPSAEL